MALTHAGGRLLLILLCYYVLLCTKLTYLTAKAWPFPIGFNNNNFGGGTKKCMRAGDGKLLYYKSWPQYEGTLSETITNGTRLFLCTLDISTHMYASAHMYVHLHALL